MSGIDARDIMEAAVRRELFGPPPEESGRGKPLDISAGAVHFDSWPATYGLWHDAATGEEILTDTEPLRRYGIGVLYPQGSEAQGLPAENIVGTPGLPLDDEIRDVDPSGEITLSRQPEPDTDDFDLSDANSFQPSAMAVSFRVRVAAGQSLHVQASCAYYDKIPVQIAGSKREWWLRRPLTLTATVAAAKLLAPGKRLFPLEAETSHHERVRPQLQAYSRPVAGDPDPDCRLVTIVLVNTTKGSGSAAALLQATFEVRPMNGARVESYREVTAPGGLSDEEASIALLYRSKRTYAIGHGCAADWDEPDGDASAAVRADPLPDYEVPSLTPDVFQTTDTGQRIAVQVSMEALSQGTAEGRQQIETVLDLYGSWIEDRRQEVDGLPEWYRNAATRHLKLCDEALERMRAGWALVGANEDAARVFRLANEAMLYQQIRSRLPLRKVRLTKAGLLQVDGSAPAAIAEPGVGNWRPFQIAFLLASLPEVFDPSAADRDLVDLIFFPTGGGKTEAYLGAAAISMFARRLRDATDVGTDVLMRYTLRLLTAQQFLRAASLLCVMEDIRVREGDLGEDRFSIGIWLGSTTTPNSWKTAITDLGKLRRDSREQNPFLLLRCPWCGAQMGPISKGAKGQEAVGYVPVGTKVRFICPDRACRFATGQGMPIHVVDEDIYDSRPTLVIGTVDKFAMLAWQTNARSLFGLGKEGDRLVSPPGLIIQDELHLIAGPLGSMVGLYEPIIEDLCTDHRGDRPTRPKIIASTATIRRYEQQVRDLYGRSRVALFPPHGLEEGRSFFAEPARSPDGSLARGRRYLGVMSPSLGSIQTVQVRVAGATLQGAMAIPEQDRDGYWTNLNFLNSLRELGNTVSLLQSDIPDYLTGVRKRDGLEPADIRWPRVQLELTSRRRSDEIPKAIEQLQKEFGEDDCVDVCLASNIIEVGVDIDRLGLMTIIGQPKTTAQYIQVSGRVGRRWLDRPGLVITIYGAAKPRDRSHYERFRSYHQRLYAQVEPTSLTPFALPVLLRGLHGAAVAHIRQSSGSKLGPDPFPTSQFARATSLIRDRAAFADSAELPTLERVIGRRAQEWRHGERTEWSANSIGGDPRQGLMRYAGSSPEPGAKVPTIWDTPTSMRTVDAECQLRITDAYAIDAASQTEDTP
jgi:hypothetical protein